MIRVRKRLLVVCTALALAAGSAAAQSGDNAQQDEEQDRTLSPQEMAGGSVEKGRKLARLHCARCHVIKDYNPYGGVGITPSFDRLVTWKDGLWRISTFFARPPHASIVKMEGVPRPTDLPASAHPFELTVTQLEHIVAWARQLKTKVSDER